MGPISYNIDVQTPFQAALQGYQAGSAIRDDQQKQAAQQAAMQQQQTMAKDLRALSMNPNAGGADYAAMMTRYPQLSEQLTKSWSTLDDVQKQNKLASGTQVYAAVSSGRPDLGAEILKRQAAAKRNSGDERGALQDEALAQTIVEHPDVGRNMVGLGLSAIMGGDKFAATFGNLGDENRKQQAFPTEQRIKGAEAVIQEAKAGIEGERLATDVANVQSQIDDRVARLALDKDKLTSEVQLKLTEMRQKLGEIPEFVAKDITAATTDAIAADQSAAKLTGLADEIQGAASRMGVGWKGTIDELVKSGFVNKNDITRMRAEYNRIVTPAAMSAYKKVATGSTSDRDIETAMKGVPPDNAPPEDMQAYLRGAAKLQQYDAVLNNAKSEWLGAVKNLGKAKSDIEVDGVQVPAGTTFKNFVDQYVEQKVAKQTAAKNQQTVQGRSYMRHVQPQQPAAPGGPGLTGVLPVTGGM